MKKFMNAIAIFVLCSFLLIMIFGCTEQEIHYEEEFESTMQESSGDSPVTDFIDGTEVYSFEELENTLMFSRLMGMIEFADDTDSRIEELKALCDISVTNASALANYLAGVGSYFIPVFEFEGFELFYISVGVRRNIRYSIHYGYMPIGGEHRHFNHRIGIQISFENLGGTGLRDLIEPLVQQLGNQHRDFYLSEDGLLFTTTNWGYNTINRQIPDTNIRMRISIPDTHPLSDYESMRDIALSEFVPENIHSVDELLERRLPEFMCANCGELTLLCDCNTTHALHNGIITQSGSHLPWRLYDNGTMVVDAGFIDWNSPISPWGAYNEYIQQITFTEAVTAGSRLRGLFGQLTNVTAITGLEHINTSAVTDMRQMFQGASSLSSISDVSGWDTSNVTNMASVFNASGLTSLDLSNWDVSSVIYMQHMFRDAHALASIGDVSGWDTGSVMNMSAMFLSARSLTELDLSGWDVGNVTDMSFMFQDLIPSYTMSLTQLNLSGWTISNGANMDRMFRGVTNLRELWLGEGFSFMPNAALPAVLNNHTYTGHWQNVGGGTVAAPAGEFVLTSAQLMAQFDGSTMADTWLWQTR